MCVLARSPPNSHCSKARAATSIYGIILFDNACVSFSRYTYSHENILTNPVNRTIENSECVCGRNDEKRKRAVANERCLCGSLFLKHGAAAVVVAGSHQYCWW